MRRYLPSIAIAALLIGLISGVYLVMAQDAAPETCPYFAHVETARTACDGLGAGELCLNAGAVDLDGDAFVLPGASRSLESITRIAGGADALATFKLDAGLPDDAEPAQVTLFGSTEIVNTFAPMDENRSTVTITNSGQFVLNMRSAPSLNGAVVTTLDLGVSLEADGRSSDGEWLHVVLEDGREAWINAGVVTVDGEIDALAALDDPIQQPMQRFTLNSADNCGGLLIQSTAADSVMLEINGARLSLDSGALVAQAEDDLLMLRVITGDAEVQVNGETVSADAGSEIQIALEGGTASAAPEVADRYAFASLASVPFDLLPQESLVCVAGVNADSAPVYRGPSDEYFLVNEIDPTTHLNVTGQATTDDGTLWYLVEGVNWVAGDAVQTYGTCGAVQEVTPQVINQQQTSPNVSQPGSDAVTTVHNLLPQGQSIWQAFTGPDTLVGTCNAPPIAACDFPSAVITNADGSIQWRGQEPIPYTMRSTGADSFTYSGRNGLNNANVTFSLNFTSASSWAGTMQIVYDDDPACTHTFNYTANRIR